MAKQPKVYGTGDIARRYGKTPARIRQIAENELDVGENPNGRGWMFYESDIPKFDRHFRDNGKDFSK